MPDSSFYKALVFCMNEGNIPGFYNDETFRLLYNSSLSVMTRIGSSSHNGNQITTRMDSKCVSIVQSLNRVIPAGSNYKIGFFYQSDARNINEVANEYTQINTAFNFLDLESHAHFYDKVKVWIYFNTSSGRTATTISDMIGRFRELFDRQKVGIYCEESLANNLINKGVDGPYWMIRSAEATGYIDPPNNTVGYEAYKNIKLDPFVGYFQGSLWSEPIGDTKYILPDPTSSENRWNRVDAHIFAVANPAHAASAYSYPFKNPNPEGPSRITIQSKSGDTWNNKFVVPDTAYYAALGGQYVLKHGIDYRIDYIGVDYAPAHNNFRVDKKVNRVSFDIVGINKFTGSYPLTVECNDTNKSDFYHVASINDIVELDQEYYYYTGEKITPGIKMKTSFPRCFLDATDFVVETTRGGIEAGDDNAVSIYPKYLNVFGNGNSSSPTAPIVEYQDIYFTIKGGDISKSKIILPKYEYYYTGNPITPPVEVPGFVINIDYYVEYSNNINLGIATVKAIAKLPNKGTLTAHFRIVKQPLSNLPVYVTPEGQPFTGDPITDVNVSIPTLNQGTDYTYEIIENRNVGMAKVICTATEECEFYTGKSEGTFNILQVEIDNVEPRFTYNDADGNMFTGYEIRPIVTFDNFPHAIENQDFSVEYVDNINIRSEYNNPRVKLTGLGNFIGEAYFEFDIESRSIDTVSYFFNLDYGPSGSSDWRKYESSRLAYFENYAGKRYFLDYPNDIEVEHTEYQYIEEAYRPYFNLKQVYFGKGNFKSSHEYHVSICFNLTPETGDPSGAFDFGIMELGLEGNRAAGDNWDFGTQISNYRLVVDEGASPIVEPDDAYRYDFNVLSGDPNNQFEAGREFILKEGTPLFIEPYTILPFDYREGSMIVYDSLIVNNRIKMTNSIGNVNKAGKLTCWVNISDLNKIGVIAVGDRVLINGKLYRDSSGNGGYMEKVDEVMYVVKSLDSSINQYPYGLATFATSELIGYASKDSLTELDG